jgi:catechol 2,3-dioxygenase-like lactoylglutathione lyase family enzyme
MKVKGFSWVGVGTSSFDETVAFFTDVMGMDIAVSEKPVAMLDAGSGAVLEIFGEGSTRGKALTTPPAIGFEVDDVRAARDELVANGVELVGDVGSWNGFEWLYFRGPEGYLFVVKKTPAPGWEKRQPD